MITLRIFVFVFMLGVVAVFTAAAENSGKVEVDLHDHRPEIRVAILKYTPLGSNTDAVLDFIKTRLKHKGNPLPQLEPKPADGSSAEASNKKGVKHIKVLLGDCLSSPLLMTMDVPMPVLTNVYVQWAFDADGRLIEIFVERKAEGP